MSAAQSGAMPIAAIRLGTRHRRDMGDISTLAASIAELGLLTAEARERWRRMVLNALADGGITGAAEASA
jgi:hypothetical protein